MPADEVIYIRLRGSKEASWCPVKAAPVGEGAYRILGGLDATPTKAWEFQPGDVVRCKPFELTDHDLILVASEKVEGPA